MVHKSSYAAKNSSRDYRVFVRRTNNHIYASVIDKTGHIHMSFDDTKTNPSGVAKKQSALVVGQKIAELAKQKGITEMVFDRSGYKYHGRVASVCDGIRNGGIVI